MKLRWFICGALLAAFLQSAVLAKIIYDRAQLLQNGTEVLLQTGMVDPRDLFRGHYVTLNLRISRIPAESVEVVGELTYREPVYVSLKLDPETGFWVPDTLYAKRPENSDAPIIAGKMGWISGQEAEIENYRVSFPVDRFFAEKERALELENVRQGNALGVIVALAEDGSSAIKGISVRGELIYSEPIY